MLVQGGIRVVLVFREQQWGDGSNGKLTGLVGGAGIFRMVVFRSGANIGDMVELRAGAVVLLPGSLG